MGDFFQRNSELSIEFSKYLLDHPELDKTIPEDAVIIFLPEYDEKLKEFNLKMAKEIEEEGKKVIYVKIKSMASERGSRLVGVDVGS